MTKRILVVDDELDLCDLVGFRLRRAGYEVQTASGGREALVLFERESFDLVVTDIRMPEGDGLELLKAIRQSSRRDIPVVLMTGFADTDARSSKAMGASAFLDKPFHLDDLLRVVRAQLGEPDSAGV